MLEKFLGRKCRIIVRQGERIIVDFITSKLEKEYLIAFKNFKYEGAHKTLVTGIDVIELVKE